MSSSGKNSSPQSQNQKRTILLHVKDIESSLLHYPPIEFADLKPSRVNKVLFHLVDYNQNRSCRLTADELLKTPTVLALSQNIKTRHESKKFSC